MNKFYENISHYLNDKLSAADRSAFEAASKLDPTLQSAIDNQDTLSDVADGYIESDMLNDIQRIRNELAQDASDKNINSIAASGPLPTQGKIRQFKKLAFAASFIGLLGLGYFCMQQPPTPDPDALYASFYRSPVTETVRGAGGKELSSSLYCDVGHQALEDQKYPQAIELLKRVYTDLAPACKDKAEWYLALALLKTNQYAEVKHILHQIVAAENHPFKDKAMQLLAKLS